MSDTQDYTPSSLTHRASGVLLHITSLPSRHGIGDLGAEAYRFVDALAAARQRYWQVLPVNPTLSEGDDSPYFSSSALAGNPLMIDLEALLRDGLLDAEDMTPASPFPESEVDFAAVREFKLPLLDKAQRRFRARGYSGEFAAFLIAHSHWLTEHALHSALREQYGERWIDWPEALRRRNPRALRAAAQTHGEAIAREQVLQYFFHRQWQQLRSYCQSRGVRLFGDMPIYVAYESADVWASPQVFQLDDNLRPLLVSGVPPDYFSSTGQLWNNPVYDWATLQAGNFLWWQQRVANNLEHYDLLRIDHFRGLVQFWGVPAGAETAMEGHWYPAPTEALFSQLQSTLGDLPVVVEDLGTITPDVVAARERFHFPGMVVLHFAFGNDDPHNPHRLENHSENAVAYLGTHDNNTTAGWIENELDDASEQRLASVLPANWAENSVFSLISLLQQAPPRLAIVTAQDLLCLPASARFNDPANPGHNWRWRLSREQFDALPLQRLGEISRACGRCTELV
jgi:4-alpha-glucanotransferase